MQGPAVYVPSKDQLAYNLQIHMQIIQNSLKPNTKYIVDYLHYV